MTVGRVYWHFDEFLAITQLTNPWGGGEDEKQPSVSADPCPKCKEVADHKLDCPLRNMAMPIAPGVNKHASGFSFRNKLEGAGMSAGIHQPESIDTIRLHDPVLADFITEANELL